jgi:uncharacterized membrane protein YphA (DoxX/SURF4 family)
MKKNILVEIISLLFIILFLYTGISKLMDYTVFKEQIATSPLLAPISGWIAILLPAIEIILSVILFIPRWRLKGLYASLVLMILFTGYIIAILTFNEHIPCSCGGVIELLSWKGHIAFNSAFIGLALAGIALGKGTKKTKSTLPGSRKWAIANK